MNAKEIFQNQVLEDVKSIARELSQVQSFSGLLAQQQKIQNLYEKFIFLKQLNTSKYQQILDNEDVEGSVKNIFEEKTEVRDFHCFQNQEDGGKSKKEAVEEVIGQWINKDKEIALGNIKKEEKTIQEEEKAEEEIKTEGLKPLNIEIAEIKTVEKEKKANPIKLDFNDSIAFISQLFNGSKADMDAEFKVLNETHTLEEARKWMEEMFTKYNWRDKQEFVERLSGLIVHRFES
jgi:hypothetical protein